MSILIQGMDMPKNCAYCPLSEYRNTSLGQILDCKRIGTVGSAVRGTHDVLNHRHPNCPLVDSPEPHWIPATEEPIPDGEYLVTWTSEIQEKPILSIMCRYSGVWDCWELQMLGHQDINVLAYMGLPEAYKPTVPPECERLWLVQADCDREV